MAPRKLRNSKAAAATGAGQEDAQPRRPQPRAEQPPKLFLLPHALSSADTRLVSLADPATSALKRYIYNSASGFYELTRVGSSSSGPRSCLISGYVDADRDEPAEDAQPTAAVPQTESGYVLEDASAYVATPFDPCFLLVPLFTPGITDSKSGRPKMARTADDLLDDIAQTSAHMDQLLRQSKVRTMLADCLEKVCETKDIMGDVAYRPDPLGLLDFLLEKARSTVNTAWPASLEHHVQRQLEAPVLVDQERRSDGAELPTEARDNAAEDVTPLVAENPSVPIPSHAPADVTESLRLRVAFQFLLASYIPQHLRSYLESVLAANKLHDFSSLDAHLTHLQSLKSEAQALRTLSDNVSRKRPDFEDDEAGELREAKRRKKEEEEKKNKAESRATKELRKVDTSGMKKLSSFFTKQAAKAS